MGCNLRYKPPQGLYHRPIHGADQCRKLVRNGTSLDADAWNDKTSHAWRAR